MSEQQTPQPTPPLASSDPVVVPVPSIRRARLSYGDPVPYFSATTETNPRFAFDTMGGRFVVLAFVESLQAGPGAAVMQMIRTHRALFDDERISLFAVTADPTDVAAGLTRNRTPGVRVFQDFDRAVARLYGALPAEAVGGELFEPFFLLIDPALRVIIRAPIAAEAAENDGFVRTLADLPPAHLHAGMELPPPVIVLPRVFEPELCARLIGLYDTNGGKESGFMREVNGRTVGINDPSHKKRSDYTIEDPLLIRQLQGIFMRRIFPEIQRVHHFRTTRMERYIVGCYDAADGGHFRAHRDNTTKGTAHRKFAVSINLNDDFEGGELSFPEYSRRSLKAPPGGAVVFSGALLHAVSKVTAGRRYAFLPFLYDDAAARLRAENNKYLGEGVSPY